MALKQKRPKRAQNYDWALVAESLRSDPGEWYTADDAPPVSTTHIMRGVLGAFRPCGAFEAVKSEGALFVRFVGEPLEPILDYWNIDRHGYKGTPLAKLEHVGGYVPPAD